MRIIAGSHRGRKIEALEGDALRPTSDKVRGALFNLLAHGAYPPLTHATRVLDVFCGTGACGLEALSRGAGQAAFIDNAAASLALARQNASALKLGAQASFHALDATHLPSLATLGLPPFDLVFLDPPYRRQLLAPALAGLLAGGWLATGAILATESERGLAVGAEGLLLRDMRSYSDTQITLLTHA